MEGLELGSLMSPEAVEKLFGQQEEPAGTQQEQNVATPDEGGGEDDNQKTAEVDFSDLLGEHPESVGSGEDSGRSGGEPGSRDDKGAPNENLFSSIAEVLRDKGFFSDLSDEKTKEVTDEKALMKLFEDKVSSMLDERQKALDRALNSGAAPEEVQEYQKVLNVVQFLEDKGTYDTLIKEGDEGERLRRQVMYQDYVNRGFSDERARKMVEKSIADGNDLEDAKEAFSSCRDFYGKKAEGFQKEMDDRKKRIKDSEERQYSSLRKSILETDSFYGGVKVDKAVRQKAYDLITKPSHREEDGRYLTGLQKYQKDNPMEFMQNVAMMYALTDGFKNVDKLVKSKVKEGVKKQFSDLNSFLNNSRRDGDGKLVLANGSPSDAEREKWTLAI